MVEKPSISRRFCLPLKIINCVDVLTRMAALRVAPRGGKTWVIDDHASPCIEDARASGNRQDQRAQFTELLALSEMARGEGPKFVHAGQRSNSGHVLGHLRPNTHYVIRNTDPSEPFA